MSEATANLSGPDFTQGVPVSAITDGAMLLGHAHGERALIARRGEELFAIGAVCTHYGAPLEQGLLVEDTLRCPWHHACFALRSGEAVRAPALNPVSCWRVEERDGTVYVRTLGGGTIDAIATTTSGNGGPPTIADFEKLLREAWSRREEPVRLIGIGVRLQGDPPEEETSQLKFDL